MDTDKHEFMNCQSQAGFECADMSALWNEATSRVEEKRRRGAALRNENHPHSCLSASIRVQVVQARI